MPKRDSVDKIVTSYFACVTAEPFTYKEERYEPKPLQVSPYIFRGFTCPASCAACCSRFSLDYLPRQAEKHPYRLTKRLVEFNGYMVPVFTDWQDDHDTHHCQHVKKDGRCDIHGVHPFSCDFELIRFLRFDHSQDKTITGFTGIINDGRPNVLTQKLYGRSHAMLRVDKQTRGAMCEMTPPTPETVAEVVRKLKRLKTWCEHFKLKHKVDMIVAWAESRNGQPRVEPLTV